MKKMKKKIKKVESDSVRDKQQQDEEVADDVVGRNSNQFPNFMALTKEEKLSLFESLHAARKNVLDSGNMVRERFGTVHDEYLRHFGSVEGSESLRDSSEKFECSGTLWNESVSSSLRPESSRSNNSAIPRRTLTKPLETIFIHMNVSTNSATSSITSSKNSPESKSLLSKEDEEGGSGKNPTQPDQRQKSKSPKRKRTTREDNSDKLKKKSSSRFVTKLPKLKKRESSRAQKEECSTSNKSQFETLKSDEKDIFFSTLREARDNILKESPDKDNEILSVSDIMKKYEKSKEATPTKIEVPRRKETCIKGKTNNMRVKVVIASSESERIKKERVSKRKERSRKSEKETTKKAVRVEKDKKSKETERKPIRPADGLRKKQQRQNNSNITARKPKDNKKAQKKGEPTKGSEESCQRKRNEEEDKALTKSERSVMKNPGVKQEKEKIFTSRRKIQKDKAKEKTEKSKKKEKSAKSEQVEQNNQTVLVEEEKHPEDVVEEVKEDPRRRTKLPKEEEGGVTEDTEPPREPAGTVKTEAESDETFFFVNEFKPTEDLKDKTEETKRKNQPDDSLSSKSFRNESGEELKCVEVESVGDKCATQSMGTTDEEITIELVEEISITKAPLSVKSEVRYQPEQTEQYTNRKRHTEKSKSMILELRLEGEDLDDCYARKPSSHLVTSDEDSVLQLWEELKLLKLSDSDCVMETESMTAQMESENISQSRFTFLPNRTSQNKVHLAQEKLIVVGSENKQQEVVGGQREAAVLDLLKSEGVIVVDGDAIEKIKNLVEALEKEAKTDTKQEVKPDNENLKNEYSQLLLEYLDYLTRLLYMLTNKREQKPKTRVGAPLTAAGSHPEFVENKDKNSDSSKKPRSQSDTNLPEDTETEVKGKAKESTLQESEVKDDPSSSLLPITDSPTTVSSSSSCEDGVPSVTTPDTRKKLIEDFLRERAKFVEESIDGFRIIKMASRGCEVDTKVQGQNRTRFKFFHIFSRFCKCVKKKGSEEDQVQRRRQRTGGKEDH